MTSKDLIRCENAQTYLILQVVWKIHISLESLTIFTCMLVIMVITNTDGQTENYASMTESQIVAFSFLGLPEQMS